MALIVAGAEKWTQRSSYLTCATSCSSFIDCEKTLFIKVWLKVNRYFFKAGTKKTQAWKCIVVPDSLQLSHIYAVFTVILLPIQSIGQKVVKKFRILRS